MFYNVILVTILDWEIVLGFQKRMSLFQQQGVSSPGNGSACPSSAWKDSGFKTPRLMPTWKKMFWGRASLRLLKASSLQPLYLKFPLWHELKDYQITFFLVNYVCIIPSIFVVIKFLSWLSNDMVRCTGTKADWEISTGWTLTPSVQVNSGISEYPLCQMDFGAWIKLSLPQ